ncbi:MAG: tautomerase family protein [Orrella sp.]
MPILTIQIPTGYAKQQKASLLAASTQAVVDSIQAPLSSIRVNLIEIEPENTIVAGEIGQPMTLIRAALIIGRDESQKAALMAALSKAVDQALGISIQHTRILIEDFEKTDLGVAGGISAKASGR